MPKDSKKEKKHSKTREDKESKQIEEKEAPKEAKGANKKKKFEFDVPERRNRATMKLHGVDNAQTFEHPASF